MADTQFLLGKIIEGTPGRDAVHIAVAPVIAAENLKPGERVGFVASSQEIVGVLGVHIGIVDPFLHGSVCKGERFWMYLFPNTITSLRHEWTHPAFGVVPDEKSESQKWIEQWAAELNQTPSQLMRAAAKWIEDEEWTYDNSETYKRADYAKWPEFWKHYENVTGQKVSDPEASIFTCAC